MPPTRSLLPREHGAYGQLAFPALSALVSGRPTIASVSLVVASVAAFLAHEPLLVLLGRRGTRARREDGRRAAHLLARALGASCLAGCTAVLLADPAARMTIAVPLALGVVVLALVLRQVEKTLVGEVVVAIALSAIALPVARMEGSTLRASTELAVAWGVAFALATLSVREVIRCHREGASRRWPLVATAGVLGVVLLFVRLSWVHWTAALALTPFCVLSLALAAAPPHPRQMKRVGWAIMGVCSLTLASQTMLHR